MKILVVDDEVISCDLIRRFLESRGYSVVTSNEGTDALQKARNEKADLIFLDIRMPDMNGIEVLRRIREFDRDVVIVMLTAETDEELKKKALKIGADEYLKKPIDFKHIEANVQSTLIKKKD